MIKKSIITTALLSGLSLGTSNVYALYNVTVTNHFSNDVTWMSPVAKKATSNPAENRGNFAIQVPGKGVIVGIDVGHGVGGGYAGCGDWGAVITYRGDRWGFYYGGQGKLSLTIEADGSLKLSGGKIYDRDHKCGQWP